MKRFTDKELEDFLNNIESDLAEPKQYLSCFNRQEQMINFATIFCFAMPS